MPNCIPTPLHVAPETGARLRSASLRRTGSWRAGENFLKASAAALAVAATGRCSALAQGANDRVRMAIIGCGNRGGRVFDSFSRGSKDCQFVAAAEVNKARLDQWMTPARQTFKLDVVGDYRRILDRKDIDAVLIATPDHSHSQSWSTRSPPARTSTSRSPPRTPIARINAMLDAYKKGKQVVQVGTHQRSWDHFIEAKKLLDAGTLGNVTQVLIVQPGLVRAAEGGRGAGAGRARLGHVAGTRAEEAVQAEPARLPRLV